MPNRICIHKDCSTRANFNYKDIKPALYCSKHKLENVNKIDTKNKEIIKIKIVKKDEPTSFPKKISTPSGEITVFKPNFETKWQIQV